jgi:hypothetical protein
MEAIPANPVFPEVFISAWGLMRDPIRILVTG